MAPSFKSHIDLYMQMMKLTRGICVTYQLPAAVLCVAGLDVLPRIHQPQEPGGAENNRNGVQHLQDSALPRHQIRMGRMEGLG